MTPIYKAMCAIHPTSGIVGSPMYSSAILAGIEMIMNCGTNPVAILIIITVDSTTVKIRPEVIPLMDFCMACVCITCILRRQGGVHPG